jgi:hypothetical protein
MEKFCEGCFCGYIKKKGAVWKYTPVLNPISYEKPNRIVQLTGHELIY